MQQEREYNDGAFVWTDLSTKDARSAKAFYTELLGLSVRDTPITEAMAYTTLLQGGRSVAGLGELPPELQAQGVPTMWQVYVKVSDLDAKLAQAVELGAHVVLPAMDVMTEGRMAIFADPTGATMGLWQPKQHRGAQVIGEPGTVCWLEYNGHDLEAAKRFYGSLFAWTFTQSSNSENPYFEVTASGDAQARGGFLKLPENCKDLPPHWLQYFRVAKLEESLARVQALKGKVHMGPMVLPKVGTMAVVADREGASFAMIELASSG